MTPRPSSSTALLAAIALAGASTLVPAPAAANKLRSRLTTIELKSCTPTADRTAPIKAWRCAGLRGYPVFYAEHEQRTRLSFGAAASDRTAAGQSLKPANTIFDAPGHRATIEWRFRRIGKTDLPYATIVRYFVTQGNRQREALVVTKVSSTEACHMAYLDASATRDAMALARSAADEMADRWSCASPPRQLGTVGDIELK